MSLTATSKTGQTILLATFFVREAHCGLDATGIQEVIRLGPLTSVRHAPADVAGIVNLRGKIVTILDLGLRLGFAKAVPSGDSRIFIIEDRNEFVGLLVDVQHMPAMFTGPLAVSLDRKSALRVREAQDGEIAQANCAYLAPGGTHTKLVAGPRGEIVLRLADDPPENGCKPSEQPGCIETISNAWRLRR